MKYYIVDLVDLLAFMFVSTDMTSLLGLLPGKEPAPLFKKLFNTTKRHANMEKVFIDAIH